MSTDDDSFFDQVRRLYEEERQGLYSYALSLTGDEPAAEDAVHAAFARLLRRGRPPREMRPFVFRSVRNAAFDGLRALAVRSAGQGVPTLRATSIDSDRIAAVRECLARLSPDERESVVLKVAGGMTFAEIGRVRRVSENTAASWYRRGLARMREMLGGGS